jgi:hypothetical protein
MFKKIQVKEAPKRRRNAVPRFETTREWKWMRAELEKGLRPTEALQVILTDEDRKKYRITNRRTVTRFVQKYLAAHNLPYVVKSLRLDGGRDIILVQHPAKAIEKAG